MEQETGKNKIWKVGTFSIAISTLLSGGIIYLLFRPECLVMFDFIKYIHLWGFLESVRFNTHFLPEWVEYNLPDSLWVFSYTLCIGIIWNFEIRKCWIIIFILPIIAIIDELLQYSQLVPGTFDFWDIFAYAIASLIGVFYIKLVKQLIKKSTSYEKK